MIYPDGLVVECNNEKYLIRNKKAYKFFSDRCFSSWRLKVNVKAESLEQKTSDLSLGFRDGSLIFDISSGIFYLISGNQARRIVNPDAFRRYGMKKYKAIVVSKKERRLHPAGEDLE